MRYQQHPDTTHGGRAMLFHHTTTMAYYSSSWSGVTLINYLANRKANGATAKRVIWKGRQRPRKIEGLDEVANFRMTPPPPLLRSYVEPSAHDTVYGVDSVYGAAYPQPLNPPQPHPQEPVKVADPDAPQVDVTEPSVPENKPVPPPSQPTLPGTSDPPSSSRPTSTGSLAAQPLSGQSYADIKSALSKAPARLFEDPDFPANDSSISPSGNTDKQFEWKRPSEICSNPVFIDSGIGISRFDVDQGELGDCWLLAAVANLTLYSDLANRVVPNDQSFSAPHYCGVFHFRFWYYGKWVEVVVDDRLPTYDGKLVYMQSKGKGEFWSALLEKAYAKLNGSYENLKGGSASEAMTDFTGGFSERFELREKVPANLFTIMAKAAERESLMSCSIEPDPSIREGKLANGLVMGHAYSITAVKEISVPSIGQVQLLRIRNPWGEVAWNGPWSVTSSEWTSVSDTEKTRLGLSVDDGGEFWMAYNDFISNYETLEVCHVSLDEEVEAENLAEGARESTISKARTGKVKWATNLFNGEWRNGISAGGCHNYLSTFWTNPQYRLAVVDPDEGSTDNMCTILVGLLQKDRRKQKENQSDEEVDFLSIGFSLYALSPEQAASASTLGQDFFEQATSAARATFVNLREVSGRYRIPPGTYVIIPSTFEPNCEGKFLLRVYSEKPNTLQQT